MKKYYFSFAMALCVAISNVACGSDDDSTDNNNSNNNSNTSEKVIPAPATAASAVAYQIPSGNVTAKRTDLITKDGIHVSADLTGINITEGGKAVIEVTTTDENNNKKKRFVTFDAKLQDDRYVVTDRGRSIGTIKKESSPTRGNSNVALTFHLKFTMNSITGELEFEAADPITAIAMEMALGNSNNLVSLARTWTIERMKLTLVFDDKSKSDASTTVNGGSLSSFIKLAEDNGVNLSEKDKTNLNKDIESVTFDKNGLFTLTYTNGDTDAANWNWVAGSGESKLNIKLMDSEMGNRFIENNSKIDIQYYPETKKVILILSTRLEDDKCDASLLINLK